MFELVFLCLVVCLSFLYNMFSILLIYWLFCFIFAVSAIRFSAGSSVLVVDVWVRKVREESGGLL